MPSDWMTCCAAVGGRAGGVVVGRRGSAPSPSSALPARLPTAAHDGPQSEGMA